MKICRDCEEFLLNLNMSESTGKVLTLDDLASRVMRFVCITWEDCSIEQICSHGMMLCVGLLGCASWLGLEGMQLTVVHEHWLGLVFVVVRHRVESLRVVEAKNHQGTGTHKVLLERYSLEMGHSKHTLACQLAVFVSIKLLLDISPKHFYQ